MDLYDPGIISCSIRNTENETNIIVFNISYVDIRSSFTVASILGIIQEL